jgi:hypothetical protein
LNQFFNLFFLSGTKANDGAFAGSLSVYVLALLQLILCTAAGCFFAALVRGTAGITMMITMGMIAVFQVAALRVGFGLSCIRLVVDIFCVSFAAIVIVFAAVGTIRHMLSFRQEVMKI